jgi:dienelactone hydrolase
MNGTRRLFLARSGAGAVAAATALALPWLTGAARAATATEAGTFDVLDLDWSDATRQRPVPVRLYLPAGPSPHAQRVPLVVFSHGIGGSRRGYSYLGQHFAAHGVASLHLQHVGSDRQVWTGGGLFGVVGRLLDAAQEQEAVNRARDLRFALDTLLHGELAPRLDAERIVAAGHSYGANTTLLASGAQVQREAGPVDLRDARVKAAIVISAPPFYGEGEPARILRGVTVPSLHVTCTDDVIRIPGYYSGLQDRLDVFDAVAGPRKWLAVYEGGSHSMFTDRGGTGGALNPQAKAATRELALAFVHAAFGGPELELHRWRERHAGILARFSAPMG